MGKKIDSCLSESFIILMTMLSLKITGKKNKIKTSFYNKALCFKDGMNYQYIFDDKGNRISLKQTIKYFEKELSNGKKKFTYISDKSENLLIAVNTKRKRLNIAQITKDELDKNIKTIDKAIPPHKIVFSTDFDKLSIALYKIAYELAFLFLGEKYYKDACATKINNILNNAIKGEYSKEHINNIEIYNKDNFPGDPYESKPYYNIGIINIEKNRIIAHIRILNTITGNFIISEHANNYPNFIPKIVLSNAKNKRFEVRSIEEEKIKLYEEIIKGNSSSV